MGVMGSNSPKDPENVSLRCSSLDTTTTVASLFESPNIITANFRARDGYLVELAHSK